MIYHLFKTRMQNLPEPEDCGEPPGIIREWAEKVIATWNLTSRERSVLDLLLKGFGDQEIADALDLQFSTVKHCVKIIRFKSKTQSRGEIFAEILRL